MMKKFNVILLTLRQKVGLNQSELAKKCNLTSVAISQLESGVRLPSYTTIIKLSKILEVEPNELFGFKKGVEMILPKKSGPKIHKLKTWPEYFQKVKHGFKTFELRKNDRNFQVNDLLKLKEWNPETQEYTGDEAIKQVSYILSDSQFGLKPGFCVLQLKDPNSTFNITLEGLEIDD